MVHCLAAWCDGNAHCTIFSLILSCLCHHYHIYCFATIGQAVWPNGGRPSSISHTARSMRKYGNPFKLQPNLAHTGTRQAHLATRVSIKKSSKRRAVAARAVCSPASDSLLTVHSISFICRLTPFTSYTMPAKFCFIFVGIPF